MTFIRYGIEFVGGIIAGALIFSSMEGTLVKLAIGMTGVLTILIAHSLDPWKQDAKK